MKDFIFDNKGLILLIIMIIVSLTIPAIMVWIDSDSYNALAQVLFDIMLFAASVGIGFGVDYGIYLVSRIIEEYKSSSSLENAISIALGTTGKAIVYIATTLVCGIVFWFVSKLMFQALMGLLLAIILLLNMLGALLIIPSIIALFKPKFITNIK